MENRKEIITYDYRTIKVKREMEAMTTDAYENLGWELTGSSVTDGSIFHVNLSFKRDRKVANKQQLLAQQEKIDNILTNIEVLNGKKKSAGLTPSLTTGTIGALTLGGGMAMIMELGVDTVGFMVGGVAIGVVGLGICALAFLVYRLTKRKKTAKISPILENEYNKLADTCDEIKK